MKGLACRVCCLDGSCASLCRADRTRQEVHAPQMPPGRDATTWSTWTQMSCPMGFGGVRWDLANGSDPKAGKEQSKGFGCVSEIHSGPG